jgi:hypothetical protein
MAPRKRKNDPHDPAGVALGNLAKRAVERRAAGKGVRVRPEEREAAAELGRRGARSRALRLTPAERRAIAVKAAAARWKNRKDRYGDPPYER